MFIYGIFNNDLMIHIIKNFISVSLLNKINFSDIKNYFFLSFLVKKKKKKKTFFDDTKMRNG